MRTAALLILGLVACKTELAEPVAQLIVLPPSEQGTMFAVVDLSERVAPEDRYGVIGDMERLGGPNLEIEAAEPHVILFRRGSFNGVVGPELVYAGEPSDARDGLDAVRLPQMATVFAVEGGELVRTEPPPAIADLRVPCDSRHAATRPSFEVDPEPRCPLGAAWVAITCDDLASTPVTRTLRSGEGETPVRLTQTGCRVDLTCADEAACAPGFPMTAILPPRGAATGDAALVELVSTTDPALRCTRTGAELATFDCAGVTYTLE